MIIACEIIALIVLRMRTQLFSKNLNQKCLIRTLYLELKYLIEIMLSSNI